MRISHACLYIYDDGKHPRASQYSTNSVHNSKTPKLLSAPDPRMRTTQTRSLGFPGGTYQSYYYCIIRGRLVEPLIFLFVIKVVKPVAVIFPCIVECFDHFWWWEPKMKWVEHQSWETTWAALEIKPAPERKNTGKKRESPKWGETTAIGWLCECWVLWPWHSSSFAIRWSQAYGMLKGTAQQEHACRSLSAVASFCKASRVTCLPERLCLWKHCYQFLFLRISFHLLSIHSHFLGYKHHDHNLWPWTTKQVNFAKL